MHPLVYVGLGVAFLYQYKYGKMSPSRPPKRCPECGDLIHRQYYRIHRRRHRRERDEAAGVE